MASEALSAPAKAKRAGKRCVSGAAISTRERFHRNFNIPEGSTADLLPWDTTDLIANKVRYTPRPIPHSLKSYSAELLELNRSFFTEPERRPQFVVLGVNSIDNRWLSTGLDGPALTAIANNYSYRNRGDRGSLVLEENANAQANANETVIWRRDFTLNPNRPRTELLELPANLPQEPASASSLNPPCATSCSKPSTGRHS